MTHDLKYIIKRILIGVGIILVLSLIRNFIILDVKAKEIENNTTKPIYYVPDEDELHFCDDFITNYNLNSQGFGYCNSIYVSQLQLHYYSNMLPTLNEEYPYYYEDAESPSYGYSNTTIKWYQNIPYKNLYNLVGYNISLYNGAFTITPNEDYSIMIEIEKSNDIDYSYDTLDLEYLGINARDQYGGNYDISDYIRIESHQYVKGYNTLYENDTIENPYYSNTSYLIVNFHVNSNVNIVSNNIIYFSNIAIYVNKGIYEEGINYLQNNKAIFNPSSSGTLKHRISFIKEGFIRVNNICDELENNCYNEIPYDGDLDRVTESDNDLFSDYEVCENLDISCYLRNIITGIKNLIVRIGNGITGIFQNITRALKNLFIPNFSQTWEEWQELKNALTTRLGFIWELEQFFANYLYNFRDLVEEDVIITIPEVRVPNFNFVIIPQGTWNISAPFQQQGSPLKALYDFYKIAISGIFFFLFMGHARRRLNTIIGAVETIEDGVVPYERRY